MNANKFNLREEQNFYSVHSWVTVYPQFKWPTNLTDIDTQSY